jgi:hypothetical protein
MTGFTAAGLVPGIHAFQVSTIKTRMAGTSPAMTTKLTTKLAE